MIRRILRDLAIVVVGVVFILLAAFMLAMLKFQAGSPIG